jgi:SAM-dependent methyltransferase
MGTSLAPEAPTWLRNEYLPELDVLDGVTEKLKSETTVADIGCGHGISTLIMAKAFPNSTFYGFDLHAESAGWELAVSRSGVFMEDEASQSAMSPRLSFAPTLPVSGRAGPALNLENKAAEDP